MAKKLKVNFSVGSLAVFLVLAFLLAGLNFRALLVYLGGAFAVAVLLGVFTAGYWRASRDTDNRTAGSTSRSWTGTERRAATRIS
jgi:hypothetical protein